MAVDFCLEAVESVGIAITRSDFRRPLRFHEGQRWGVAIRSSRFFHSWLSGGTDLLMKRIACGGPVPQGSGSMIIAPKIRGFICTTAHPTGCARHVAEQVEIAKAGGTLAGGPKKVLVIGSSTGYGLASRIAAAFGSGAATIGVFFERAAEGGRTATAGWYNTAAFESEAADSGLYARSFNGDAYSDEIKSQVIAAIREDLGQVDCVIYSLASPRRVHPRTGETLKSVLKPVGGSYTNKTLNTTTGEVSEIRIEPADELEISETVAVMGGEDWEMWMDALVEAGVLAKGVTTVAYSYIGPEMTWPIYKNGTIGKAKEDVERAAEAITATLAELEGRAYVSVNKALVTQASSAIPVVPLYISLLYKAMKAENSHEDCIEQMDRLFRERLYSETTATDEEGRIRIDDLEMEPRLQALISERWNSVDSNNLRELADFDGYRDAFLKLFGFGLDGVDYDADIDPDVKIRSI